MEEQTIDALEIDTPQVHMAKCQACGAAMLSRTGLCESCRTKAFELGKNILLNQKISYLAIPDNSNIREYFENTLPLQGFDGLYNNDSGCFCLNDYLMPDNQCESCGSCCPGHEIPTHDGLNVRIGE
jgi:hypothetical protein